MSRHWECHGSHMLKSEPHAMKTDIVQLACKIRMTNFSLNPRKTTPQKTRFDYDGTPPFSIRVFGGVPFWTEPAVCRTPPFFADPVLWSNTANDSSRQLTTAHDDSSRQLTTAHDISRQPTTLF